MLELLLGIFALLSLAGIFMRCSTGAVQALDDESVGDDREGEEDYLSRQREHAFCDDVYSAHEAPMTDVED